MYIKPRHRHVDIHGQVFLPYLHSWNPRTSSLQEAIATTISVFEQDSPVFSKPAPQPAVAQAIPMGYGGAGAMAGAGRGAGYGMAQPVQPQPQPYQPQPQYQPQPAAIPHSYPLDQKHAQPQSQYQPQAQYQPAQYQARPIVAAQLEAESKAAQLRETKNAVAQLLQQKCAVLYQRTGEEIGSLMEQQEILKKRSEQTGLHAQALQQEKAQLAASIKQMETKSKEIETWLQQHDTEAKLNPDEVVIYKDSWSQQIFECVARDNAIEDTLEVLDRALRDDRIELTAFLKQVRKLARKQFFARALAIKIGKEQAGIR
jgi:ESCRT-I complex subunit TSG101